MVAYDSGGVFVDVWIGAEDKLPRMLRAIYVMIHAVAPRLELPTAIDDYFSGRFGSPKATAQNILVSPARCSASAPGKSKPKAQRSFSPGQIHNSSN